MVDKLLAFLAKHKISTHMIAVVMAGVIVLYKTDADFRGLVVTIQHHLPGWVTTLAVAGWSFYSWYRNSQKPPTQ